MESLAKKLLGQDKAWGGFPLFVLAFVGYGWYVFFLALFGIFHTFLVGIGALIFGGLAFFALGQKLLAGPMSFRIVVLGSLIYALFIFFITEPTLFSGRDQGSISEAAYRLAENGALPFEEPAARGFFEIYGPGAALNFPGFAYTQEGRLLTQFPLGYTAFAGSFVSLFGLSGFAFANALLFFLFLLLIYRLVCLFSAPWWGFGALALAGTSFLPTWFAKFTLSENMALFLFVALLYGLYQFLKTPSVAFFLLTYGAATLLAFTRIEGFIILALTFGVLVFRSEGRSFWKRFPWLGLVIPLTLFTFLFLRVFFINLPYFKVIGKAFLEFLNDVNPGTQTRASFTDTLGADGLGMLFLNYGLLFLLVAGIFSLLVFAKEKKYALLLPAFIALPAFLYLFVPSITPDHPWMLRRYLPMLFPVFVFSAALGTALLFSEKNSRVFPLPPPRGKRRPLALLVFLILVSASLPIWAKSLTLTEPVGLLPQVLRFAEEFGEHDLILVDRFATGSGFAMLTGPAQYLTHRQTVYFFNPQDLERLDLSSYERVYLVTPPENAPRYLEAFGERLSPHGTFTFHLEQLKSTRLQDHLRFPEKEILETENRIYEIRK